MELKEIEKVQVKQGLVIFDGFETVKEQAYEVARVIRNSELTEDNIKQNKKMLASANKIVSEFNARRIAIKKEMLKPYDDFESQIKEITGIIQEADKGLRVQVKAFEDLERDKKEKELKEIWEMRFRPYQETLSFIQFEDFLKPQHLNKTTSIKKIEEEMAQFLNEKENDINVINQSADRLELLIEYKQCLNLAQSFSEVNYRKQQKENLEKVMQTFEPTQNKRFLFTVYDEKDAKLTEMLLNENKINFEMKEV